MKSSSASPEFDPSYYSQVIENPVKLPKLHDFSKYHEAYVTGTKLQEMYQIIFTFLDDGVQEIVPYPVILPIMHNFDRVNREAVTVAILRELYRALYKVESATPKPSLPPITPGSSG